MTQPELQFTPVPEHRNAPRKHGRTRAERVLDVLQAHRGEWVDGRLLATAGGFYAWRSRVSDLRLVGFLIENRQRHEDGYTISEYRLI